MTVISLIIILVAHVYLIRCIFMYGYLLIYKNVYTYIDLHITTTRTIYYCTTTNSAQKKLKHRENGVTRLTQ